MTDVHTSPCRVSHVFDCCFDTLVGEGRCMRGEQVVDDRFRSDLAAPAFLGHTRGVIRGHARPRSRV